MTLLWLEIGAKMVSAALIVVLASVAVERAGPLLGGLMASLPVSAGPAYVFLATEHGAAFIATSVPASLASLGATAVFALVFAALARRHGRTLSTLCAICAWAAVVTPLRAIAPGIGSIAAIDAGIFAVCLLATWRWRHAKPTGRPGSSLQSMALRAGAVMVLVGSVILAGRLLGPAAAGELALAPVVMTSLGLLLHPRIGGPATAAVMVNMLLGLSGYVPALTVLGLTARPFGAAASLLLALLLCLGWNAGLLLLNRCRQRRRS